MKSSLMMALAAIPAQTDDDLGLHQCCLPPQIADAGILFDIQRVPVLRRAALHHVGDVDLGTVQMDDLQHIVQQLPGPAYKGNTLLVLVLAGAFAMSMISAVSQPSPNTTWVLVSASAQPRAGAAVLF